MTDSDLNPGADSAQGASHEPPSGSLPEGSTDGGEQITPESLLRTVERLQGLGLEHLIPVGEDKTPKGLGLWRNGEVDYATVPMSRDEWRRRLDRDPVRGIAVIGNPQTGVVTLDVELRGMGEPLIQEALSRLPETCQRTSASGGRHAYLLVEGDYPDHPHQLAQHPPPEGGSHPILLAEVRLFPNYAVIVGPGRPPLADYFAPHRISRPEYDEIIALIGQSGTYFPTTPPRRPYKGTGRGGGTGDIITEAVRDGALSPLAVLPDGWEVTGHDAEGRIYVLRPGSKSDTSGNVKDGVVTIHSTSVDWAPTPPEGKSAAPMSSAECFARSRHAGDYRAAMFHVEAMAATLVDQGAFPDGPWGEATDVLVEVHRQRQSRTKSRGVQEGMTTDEAETGARPQEEVEHSGDRRVVLTQASGIKPQPTTWTWEGRIASGTLALVAGPEGTGKSTLAYTLCAGITRGTLPGAHEGTPRAVLIACTEDSWSRTIVPRLMAAGADLDRVWRIDVVTSLDTSGTLSLPRDVPELEKHVADTGAALLLFDPIISRVDGGLDTHRDQETRQALEPIAMLADRTGTSVVGVIHFNKSRSTNVLDKVMASKAFTAVARSVSVVVRDPNDDTGRTRVFGTVKNNLGRGDLPLLPFTIEEHTLISNEGDHVTTSQLIWAQPTTGTIDDLMRQTNDTGAKTKVAAAAEWLSSYLDSRGGRSPSKDIIKAGGDQGYSRDLLKRAFTRLQLVHKRDGYPASTWWMTPGEAARWDAERATAKPPPATAGG